RFAFVAQTPASCLEHSVTTNSANIFASGMHSGGAGRDINADKRIAESSANSARDIQGTSGALPARAVQRTVRTPAAQGSDTATSAPVRLLLIEDDVRLAQLVRDYLTQ